MRIFGHLKKWNDDRGFGFIVPSQNTNEIFVHISAFPKGGERPQVGELISFEIQIDKDGKKRAIKVIRTGSRYSKQRINKPKSKNNLGSLKIPLVLLTLAILVYFTNNTYNNQKDKKSVDMLRTITPKKTINTYKCDGRQHCSQMHSREEAEYFIKNCPNTKMDGDHDGVPCENDSRF